MSNYNDDAAAWFASQGQQIQDFEAPPMPEMEPTVEDAEVLEGPGPDRPYGGAPTVTGDDVRNVQNMRVLQEPTAKIIVGVMDTVIPLVVMLLMKNVAEESMKLEESEREELELAWAAYLGDKNVQVSPGVALIVCIVTVYGSKVISVMQDRKQREERNALYAQLAEQKEQIEQLKQQLTPAHQKAKEAQRG